jgi:hypothetical protein
MAVWGSRPEIDDVKTGLRLASRLATSVTGWRLPAPCPIKTSALSHDRPAGSAYRDAARRVWSGGMEDEPK